MTKKCIDCGREFTQNSKNQRRHCGRCHYQKYQKEYQKKYIQRPEVKENIRKRTNEVSRQRRLLVREIKEERGCIDCGIKDWRVLDFDHVRGEKKDILAYIGHRRYSITTIMEEIDKCEVRCANCHRIKTIDNNESQTKRKDFMEVT